MTMRVSLRHALVAMGVGAAAMVAAAPAAEAELFQALQLGTLDATAFGQPAIDRGLGPHQVAKRSYVPGWNQPASLFHPCVHKPL